MSSSWFGVVGTFFCRGADGAARLAHHLQRRGAQENAVGRGRRRRADRSHAGLADASQTLGLSGLPGRRELRHMMYTREEELTQLKADIAAWLEA